MKVATIQPATVIGGAMNATSDSEFAAFYQAGYGRLTTQLYAYLGDATEAEDVVQEAYLRAWRRWSSISGYDEPVAWVRRVAWNLATNRLRRLAVTARHLRRHPPETAMPALGPDRVALVAALRRVPDRERQALVLHYIADLSIADIAAQLDTPRGTVGSWRSRGRARLAGYLAESPPEGSDLR
jgi:RNA polymerase sigma-70 factor (ECF subfamily)